MMYEGIDEIFCVVEVTSARERLHKLSGVTSQNEVRYNPLFKSQVSRGSINWYTNREVQAEMGNALLAGAAIGRLLFLLDPILGILGAVLGGTIIPSAEKNRVDRFNNS